MKKVVLSAALLAASIAPALSADLVKKSAAPVAAAPAAPPPWDIAFGGAISTDYNFRGVSQSDKGPSAGAYIEPQFNTAWGQFYVGVAGWSIDWPSGQGYGFTDPAAEIDLYGGWRYTWGQLSLDLGIIDYYYPKEKFNGFTTDSDFYEIYAKLAYAVTKDLTIGGNIFWTPDLLNYSETWNGSDVGATYASLTGKWVTPWTWGDVGLYLSGELGHWWIDGGNWSAGGVSDPDYTYWNAGAAFTYKALTLDLRYHGTDQSRSDCNSFLVVGAANKSGNWCGDAYIASIKFDTTLSALK